MFTHGTATVTVPQGNFFHQNVFESNYDRFQSRKFEISKESMLCYTALF